MDFLSLSLRLAGITNSTVYSPVVFDGEWSAEDMSTMRIAITPHVPEAVWSTYNNWIFIKMYNGRIEVSRATWSFHQYFDTAEQAAQYIAEYHKVREF